jgi:hypothetical protein
MATGEWEFVLLVSQRRPHPEQPAFGRWRESLTLLSDNVWLGSPVACAQPIPWGLIGAGNYFAPMALRELGCPTPLRRHAPVLSRPSLDQGKWISP